MLLVKFKGHWLAECPVAQGRSVFVLVKASLDWIMSTHIREAALLYSKSADLISSKSTPGNIQNNV